MRRLLDGRIGDGLVFLLCFLMFLVGTDHLHYQPQWGVTVLTWGFVVLWIGVCIRIKLRRD